MKIVHAADIHLDSPLHGLERYEGVCVETMRGATRRAFANLVQLCGEEQADLLLLAGDIYDGDWRDFGTGLHFAAQMSRLREMGVRVFLVRGNHDAASRITKSLRLPENVHVFSSRKPETVRDEQLGVAVHGQSFARPDVTDDLATRYPAAVPGLFNVGLLHTSADGRPGHEPYAPCRLSDLLTKGYEYWALGHVHAREVLNEQPWVVFPGNLQGRHARETGPKGCTVVEVENGDVVSVEERYIDVVRWAHVVVDAAGCSHPSDILGRLEAALRAALRDAEGRGCAARVSVRGRCRAHHALVERRESWTADARATATDVGAGAIWLEKILLETAPEDAARVGGALQGPVAELAAEIAAVRGDEDRLTALAEDFSELIAKLPADVREGDDGFRLDVATLRALLADSESLLLQRLVGEEEER